MKILILFYLVLVVYSCDKQQEQDTTLFFTKVTQGDRSIHDYNEGWYVKGNFLIDSLNLLKGKKALHLFSKKSTQRAEAYYYINAEEIEGDSILFSGKYKYINANNANIIFGVCQKNINDNERNSIYKVKELSGNSDWIDFKVETALDKTNWELSFFIKTEGEIQLWVNDCTSQIDNKTLGSLIYRKFEADREFDNGSRLDLEVLTPQMAENLEILCKIWGFLKYYHPEVTQGKYNWDYELFRILPPIANAKDKKERDRLLNKWIDKYGKINETIDYTITDSSKYSRIINLDWLSDKGLFDEKLINKLYNIKRAKRNYKFNYYVVPFVKTSKEYFGREKMYENISWNDQGFRILTLFRLWNTMEYCFPYVEMTDRPWQSLIKKFIPKFFNPKSKSDYELTIMELAAHINDSHGQVDIPSSDLKNTVLAPMFYNKVPIQLIETEDGKIVVQSTQIENLKRGDIIYSVNNKNIKDILKETAPYIPASNKPSLTQKILSFSLNSEDSLQITSIREGRKKTFTLHNKPQKFISGLKSWKDYSLAAQKIAYIDLSMPDWYITNVLKNINNAKGLIIDLRNYPTVDFSTLYSILTPKTETFIWFSQNEKSFPGNFKYITSGEIGTEGTDYFKGKVAILVNEDTQSYGEYSAMAYHKAPQSTIIGSTTAGADGNIARFHLPGKILFTYTGLGAYYPQWKKSQRKGVDINIKIRPTVEEIRNGQDIWIEKAVEYILG